jgi:membrane protease YdiL (CAAX protease family)
MSGLPPASPPDPAPGAADPRAIDVEAAAPPARRRRARVEALAEVALCSSVPTQIVVAWLASLAGLAPLGDDEALSLPFVVVVSLGDTVLLVGLMVALTRARGERLRDLWLGPRPPLAEGARGLLLVPVVFGLVLVSMLAVRAFLPGLEPLDGNPFERLAGTPADAAALGVVGVLAGGVREELQRAFLLQRFERHLGGPVTGVVVLSAAFGLGHVVQGWDAVVATGVLGAFWALVYLRRRSVVAPMVSHAAFNALQILALASLTA